MVDASAPPPPRPRNPLHLAAYALSLPERALRSVSALVGGLLQALSVVLPGPLRRSRFYRTAVERQLRLMTDVVGQAGLFRQNEEVLDGRSMFRMGVGGAVDNLLILGLRASPIWILLAATDVCQGAQSFARQLADELRDAGFVEPDSPLETVDQVLLGLSRLSDRVADTLDKPPLSRAEMAETVKALRSGVGGVVAPAAVERERLDHLARDLMQLGAKTRRPLVDVSVAVAAGALRRSGRFVAGTAWGAAAAVRLTGRFLWDKVVLDYAASARRLQRLGYERALWSFMKPQRGSARRLFAYPFLSWTEIVLSFGRWRRAVWAVR